MNSDSSSPGHGRRDTLRALGFFVLGFLLAYAIYLAGGWDRLSDYWESRYVDAVNSEPPPPVVTSTPIVPVYPTTSSVLPATAPDETTGDDEDVIANSQDENGENGDDDTGDLLHGNGENGDDGAASPPSNAAANDDQNDGMLALRVSTRERYAEAPGCSPTYTIVNDTHRPILLRKGRRHRDEDDDDGDDRGSRRDRGAGAAVVHPGESEVLCAERRGTRGFDYYSPHPDADVPPEEAEFVARTVKIRLKGLTSRQSFVDISFREERRLLARQARA